MELGIGEMLIVALVIVVLFGPDKLPSIARDLGAGVRKMKSAMEDIKTEVMKEADNPISDIKKEINKVKESVEKANPVGDVQKQIEEMKQSVNPMSSTKVTANKVDENNDIPTETNPTPEPQIDPLSDEYVGPVSR